MSHLYQLVQDKRKVARIKKNSEETSFYTSLLGDIENKGKAKNSKGIDDQLIIGILKAMKDSLNKFKSDCVEKGITIPEEKLESMAFEIAIIDSLLPKMLTNQELEGIILGFFHSTRLATQPFNVPWVMQYLNSNYPNRFDRGHAAKVVKEQYENIPIRTVGPQ